jgi:cytochrome P450
MEKAAEVLILAIAVLAVMRVCCSRAFLLKLRAFPKIGVQLFLFFAVYAAIVTTAALYSPWALRFVASMALLAIALNRWRARPSYGRARGLPPGSLAIAPIGPWVDQADYLKRAARYGPVFKMNNFLQPMVCVVGLKSGAELLRSHDADLSVPPLPFDRYVPGGFIRYMAADKHRMQAARLRAAISNAVIRDHEPAMVRIAVGELEQLAKESTANGAGIPPRPYLTRMVFAMFAEVFFGIDHLSEELGELRRCYSMIHYSRAWKTSSRTVEQNLRKIEALVRAGLSTGSSPSFVSELSRGEPASNLDGNALRNLIYVLLLTSTDVTGLMHWVIKIVCDHPEWIQKLRDDPKPDELAQRIVRETLRLEQSEYLIRRTRRTIRWRDFVIPRGWFVRVCVRESHHSGDVFADPEKFDPDRFRGERAPARSEYSPLGMSRIACLGEQLTLTTGRILLTTLANNFDLSKTADGPPEYGGFHWQPSFRFRIRLSPGTAPRVVGASMTDSRVERANLFHGTVVPTTACEEVQGCHGKIYPSS